MTPPSITSPMLDAWEAEADAFTRWVLDRDAGATADHDQVLAEVSGLLAWADEDPGRCAAVGAVLMAYTLESCGVVEWEAAAELIPVTLSMWRPVR